ncbi:DUF4191 domain-containing protein [Georgenia sp. 10Sc9-8]|uniref:DUF4191 domain-containing protein n=1 Tax=Georgenia halotolerans TaxID=3028317 RepID=A0ABT5TVQ6_9MICO|nr:DUF4191 domain-containing protein [Georgenia halotolerans]
MARKKSSTDAGVTGAAPAPKKKRWYHNLVEAYRMTRQVKPAIGWMMLGAAVGVMVLAIAIGLWVGHPIYLGLFGLTVAVLVAMSILAFHARRAGYAQIEGRPGAVGAVLGQIKRGWDIEQEPVAINPRTQDLVYRLVGRPGIVLISEGPPHRVQRMLKDEERKVSRVAPNVTVHRLQCGREEGQIPLPRLENRLRKLPRVLTNAEVTQVAKRLRALGAARMPIPKGVDPMRARPDRKGMRGR